MSLHKNNWIKIGYQPQCTSKHFVYHASQLLLLRKKYKRRFNFQLQDSELSLSALQAVKDLMAP